VPGTRYFIVQTESFDDIPDVPAIRVLYWFDDERVVLVQGRLV
jgi:hypothetical protein